MAADPEEEEEEEEPAAKAAVQQRPVPTVHQASAKKKGKAKKRRGGTKELGEEEIEQDAPEPQPRQQLPPPAWVGEVQAVFAGCLLMELLQQSAWTLPSSTDEALGRLAQLAGKLPWSSPLGLQLPLEWKEFVGLGVDGGPPHTSKRGTPPWVLRLQKHLPWLLGHYITILFFVTLLHALSQFGFLLWITVAQAAIILAPPDMPHIKAPARALLLQAVHFLLWLFFVRSIWQMHLFVKLLVVGLAVGHSYMVTSTSAD